LLNRQPGQIGGAKARQQPVEGRPIRFEIEPFDIEHPAVARLHQHRNATGARLFSDQKLHVERVALFDDEIEAIEEGPEILGRDSFGNGQQPQVGIDLADPPRRHKCLIDPKVEDGTGNAIEVRELEGVEVGQAQFPRQAFHGQDVGDAVTGTEANHPDAEGALPGLLRPRQFVAVPVESQGVERTRSQQSHDGATPRVVDPALGLLFE
jgi:hypothetical protein